MSYALVQGYKDYYSHLYWIAYKFVGQNARDLIQEVFLKLLKNKEQRCFLSAKLCRSYLSVVVANAAKDALTDAKGKKERLVDMSYLQSEDWVPRIDSYYVKVEEEKDKIIQQDEAMIAFNSLPRGAKQVVTMAFQGMMSKEIAEKLHLSIHTVKNQKARAIALMRKSIQQQRLARLRDKIAEELRLRANV